MTDYDYDDYDDDDSFVATIPAVQKTLEQIEAEKIEAEKLAADKAAVLAAWRERNPWQNFAVHFGKKSGAKIAEMSARDLGWWKDSWSPNDDFCKFAENRKTFRPDRVAGANAGCKDCSLRLALDAAEISPVEKMLATVAPLPAGDLTCKMVAGEKITRSVRVEKVSSWTSEFNRKKVTTFGAYLRNCDALFYWKSSSMPDEISEGAELEISGTVKDNFIKDIGRGNENVISLLRVKIVAGKILTPKASLVLFCDGKSSAQRIAVCDEAGEPLFAGKFYGDSTSGDNTDHELAAALKALEIADAARASASHDCISLELKFDAKWMEGMVGKAAPLRAFARSHGLKVTMTHIPGVVNPADQWTVGGGEINNALPALK